MSLRIASLLPSATEIICSLGLREYLVGVSHECDYPADVGELPALTSASVDSSVSSAEIHRQVTERVSVQALSIYDIDEDLLAELRPTLIVTQDTCEVCAVSRAEVERSVATVLGGSAHIVSLAPLTLEDVLGDITRVGHAAGVRARADDVVASLRTRAATLRAHTRSLPAPTVLALEWLAPPMVAGHWTPELLRLAGGQPVLGHDGMPTRATDWAHIAAANPETILIIPCGFRIDQSLSELDSLYAVPEFAALTAVRAGRVTIIDGNAYFNRPGPRLIDSAELAAVALHRHALRGRIDIDERALASGARGPT